MSASLSRSPTPPASRPSTSPSQDPELYWFLLRRLSHYLTGVLPSLSSLADEGHSLDHVTATLLNRASPSLSGFTLPVYRATSQQLARSSALFDFLSIEPLRLSWRVSAAHQRRLYGSTASSTVRRPASAASSGTGTGTGHVGGGGGASTPTRPSSARGSRRSSTGSHSARGGSVGGERSARSSCVFFARSRSHDKLGEAGFNDADVPRSAPPPLRTWSRSSSQTEMARTASSTSTSLFAMGPAPFRKHVPSQPPLSQSELVHACPPLEHAAGCRWLSGSSAGARRATADTTAVEVVEGHGPALMAPGQLVAVFMHDDLQSTSAPASAPVFCAVCAAQLWLQRVWLCVRLVQRLDELSQIHVSLAPFPLASAMTTTTTTTTSTTTTSPTPRVMLAHRYHVARRLGVLGLELALGTGTGTHAGTMPTTAAAVVACATTHFATTLSLSVLNTAVGLLADVPLLWPALPSPQKQKQKEPEASREARRRAWYRKDSGDVDLVVRAALLRAVLLLFSDPCGSDKALAVLATLAAAPLVHTHDSDACALTRDAAIEAREDVADDLLACVCDWHQSWQRDKARLAAAKKAALDAARANPTGSLESAQGGGGVDALESQEKALWQCAHLQHVLGLLVIFADLVGDRDALTSGRDDDDDVGEDDEGEKGRAAGRLSQCEPVEGERARRPAPPHTDRRQHRYHRLLTRALPLLTLNISAFWVAARDEAVEGSAGTRARQGLALTHLLTAELHRWLRHHAARLHVADTEVTGAVAQERTESTEAVQAVVASVVGASESQSRATMTQLAQKAVAASGAAREFVHATTIAQAASSGGGAGGAMETGWRYQTPPAPGSTESHSETRDSTLSPTHPSRPVVTSLAVLPVEFIRLWCVLCPFLFPSSCLAEFMQLQDDDERHQTSVDADMTASPATRGADSASAESAHRATSLHKSQPSQQQQQQQQAPKQRRVARGSSRDGRPRATSRTDRAHGPSRLSSPAAPASLSPTRKGQATTSIKSTKSDTRTASPARDAHERSLETLRERLWYSPAPLPFHWRWEWLRTHGAAPSLSRLAPAECLYAVVAPSSSSPASSSLAWPSCAGLPCPSVGEATGATAPLSSLTAALTQGRHLTLPALRAVFPEPFASSLHTVYAQNGGHAPRDTDAVATPSPSTTTTTTTTAETLCADLGALYGSLLDGGCAGTREAVAVPSSANVWPVTAGLPVSSVVCVSEGVQSAVTSYAVQRLPPFVQSSTVPPEPTERPSAAAAAAAAVVAQTTASPLRSTPRLTPASRGPSGHSSSVPSSTSSRITTPTRTAGPGEEGVQEDSRVPSEEAAERALRRRGSSVAPVPALHMRLASRLSRRPALLLTTPSAPANAKRETTAVAVAKPDPDPEANAESKAQH